MHDQHEQGVDDQSFLDSVLDRALRSIEDGVPIDARELAGERPHLESAVRELVTIARQTAATCPEAGETPRVEGFEILREIGRGAMGAVYLAKQAKLGGREVALKVLPAAAAGSRRSRERFRNEANAIARLRHPNIVAVHDVVSDGRTFAYAMEHIDGLTVQGVIDWVGRAGGTRDGATVGDALGIAGAVPWGPKYWRFASHVGASVARALDAVHRAGMLHRDVKPSNIFLRRDGTALLGDFGLARDPMAEIATETMQFVGTPAYASPEQLAGERDALDARSDVYALGASLYHALALRTPYAGRSAVAVLRAIEAAPPTGLRRISAEIPADLETIIGKAMDPDPARRYRSAGEMGDDLDRLLRGEPIAARPATTLYIARRFAGRHPGLVGGAMTTLLVLVLGLAGVGLALRRAIEARAQADLNAARSRMSAYEADIQAAAASLRADDAALAHRILAEAPADLRGWEWNYLSAQLDQSIDSLVHLDAAIQCLSLSPDGGRLAAGDFRTLVVLDLRRRVEVARVDVPALTGENLRSVAWSPDSARLYVGSHARGVSVFDAGTLARLPDLPLREGAHYPWIAVRADGWIAAGGEYRTPEGMRRVLTVVDPRNGRLILDHDEPGTAPAFSWVGDSPRILVKDNTHAWLVDVLTGAQTPLPFRIIGGGHGWDAVVASPDGSLLAVSNQESTQVWNAADLTLKSVLHSASPFKTHRLCFSPDGTRLFCLQGSRMLGWDIASGRQTMRARGEHGSNYPHLVASPDGRTIYAGHDDGTVRAWASDTLSEGVDFQARDTAGISADFTRVAYTQGGWPRDDDPALVMVKDLATGTLREQFALGSKDGTTRGRVAFSPDGRFLLRTQEQPHVPGEFRGRVYLRDLRSGATCESEEIPDTLDAVNILPDGNAVIVNGRAAAYELSLPELAIVRVYPLPPGSLGGHLSVAPDGSSFARTRLTPGTKPGDAPRAVALELRRITDGALIREIVPASGGPIGASVFSPDARFLACQEAGDPEVLVMRRVSDGVAVASLGLPGLSQPGLCFDPSGTRLFAGLRDGTIRVIAFASPLPGLPPELHEVLTLVSDYWMDTPVISPDGRRLACLTVWPANRCVVWDAKPERERWEERRAWERIPAANAGPDGSPRQDGTIPPRHAPSQAPQGGPIEKSGG